MKKRKYCPGFVTIFNLSGQSNSRQKENMACYICFQGLDTVSWRKGVFSIVCEQKPGSSLHLHPKKITLNLAEEWSNKSWQCVLRIIGV